MERATLDMEKATIEFYLGIKSLNLGNNQEAISHFDNVLASDVLCHGHYVPLGKMFELAGDKTKAAIAFRKAISLKQDDPVTYALLARVLLSIDIENPADADANLNETMTCLDKARELYEEVAREEAYDRNMEEY